MEPKYVELIMREARKIGINFSENDLKEFLVEKINNPEHRVLQEATLELVAKFREVLEKYGLYHLNIGLGISINTLLTTVIMRGFDIATKKLSTEQFDEFKTIMANHFVNIMTMQDDI